MPTKIEWCDETWNPTVGCQKVSAGCANCYAERMAARLLAMGRFEYENTVGILSGKWTGHVKCLPERLDIPLKWKKPRHIFVDSMSDLFHEDVPDSFITAVWSRMIATSQHTYIILTKRPERMAQLVPLLFREWPNDDPVIQPNVWLGVSVEDQKTADERIPWLLRTPAAKRIVSVEPMLEAVRLDDIRSMDAYRQTRSINALLDGEKHLFWKDEHPRIDQVICGCESGPNRRPMDIDWARSLRDQCVAAGVPFFLKQMQVNGKVVKMPELDGRVWAQYPGGE